MFADATTSDGDWYPFLHESDDGYDTIEWAAALPYSDGRVGMYGGSYVGATQMLAAIAHPPHLAGICPVVTASNYHDGWTYQGGAFEQWFNESWTSGLAQDTLNRFVRKSHECVERNRETSSHINTRFSSYRRHPPMQTCCILWLLTFSTGWPIPAMTSIGSAGPLRITMPTSAYPR